MKLITLLCLMLASCAIPRASTSRPEANRYRIHSIQPVNQKGYWITLQGKSPRWLHTFCDCTCLPDSVKVGNYINL